MTTCKNVIDFNYSFHRIPVNPYTLKIFIILTGMLMWWIEIEKQEEPIYRAQNRTRNGGTRKEKEGKGKKKELRNRGKCPCTHVVCNINLDILLIPRQSNWKFFCYLFTILWIITYFIVKTNFVSIILLHFLRIHVGCCLLREDVTWILYVICNLFRTRPNMSVFPSLFVWRSVNLI